MYLPSVQFYNRMTLPWRMEERTTLLHAEGKQSRSVAGATATRARGIYREFYDL